MTEELIKFTPGQRPAHIGPDELVQARFNNCVGANWMAGIKARDLGWTNQFEYRLASRPLTDDQLEAQCKARGWTVTKPLVTQSERDRLAAAFEAMSYHYVANEVRGGSGDRDKYTRAFIDTYEGIKP